MKTKPYTNSIVHCPKQWQYAALSKALFLGQPSGVSRIEAYESLNGPDGVRFELYPVHGIHTYKEVSQARAWLRHSYDLTRIVTEWQEAAA